MDAFGIDRNRTYTREEICRRFGYDDQADPRNTNRFFRDYFLRRRLLANKVGKTYEVAGEAYYAWTIANSRPQQDDED
jgi:hypothetical protein